MSNKAFIFGSSKYLISNNNSFFIKVILDQNDKVYENIVNFLKELFGLVWYVSGSCT